MKSLQIFTSNSLIEFYVIIFTWVDKIFETQSDYLKMNKIVTYCGEISINVWLP